MLLGTTLTTSHLMVSSVSGDDAYRRQMMTVTSMELKDVIFFSTVTLHTICELEFHSRQLKSNHLCIHMTCNLPKYTHQTLIIYCCLPALLSNATIQNSFLGIFPIAKPFHSGNRATPVYFMQSVFLFVRFFLFFFFII